MKQAAFGAIALLLLNACAIPVGDAQGDRYFILGVGLVELPERNDNSLQLQTTVFGLAVATGDQPSIQLGYASTQTLFVPPNYGWVDPNLTDLGQHPRAEAEETKNE